MKPDQEHGPRIQLGRGRPYSGEALAEVWRAVLSRHPAADWTKGRLLTLAVTLGVLIWAGGGIWGAVEAGLDVGPALDSLALDKPETDNGDGDRVEGRRRLGAGLRSDLFKVPTREKAKPGKGPTIGPAELLKLIELQGVMGGSNPRAMVLYKATNETVTVSVGDDLGEFEVMQIRDRSVVLKWRNEEFILSL